MVGSAPRVVLVTRETEYEGLLARHGTHAQAAFFLETRGQLVEEVKARHEQVRWARRAVLAGIPMDWRRSQVHRADLDRFLFEPDDTVVVVGQDGLVANTAKYLDGQPVIGINPAPDLYDGVLVPFSSDAAHRLIVAAAARRAATQPRTMVEAALPDGQRLLALNEIFVGARTHQSARYQISVGDHAERQISSGVIVASGTGATGWARSINRERRDALTLPAPSDDVLAFFVREVFPSVATGVEVTAGLITADTHLTITSEMNGDGVLFGDGIEGDRLAFDWGVTATLRVAPRRLQLVVDG